MNQTLLPQSAINHKVRRISRDEMNLAEFPLTVLSTRTDSNRKTLEFKDALKTRSGELIERSWIITAADKFGLPTASDDEILLGLIKLTVDDGFRDRKVYFTRYELLRILHWSTEGRSYIRLQKALDRLSGVRIKATNAFYDNELKSHSTRNFGILDAYEINDGRSSNPKPSFFMWSEVIFKSFHAGFIKKLDLDFYLSLKSAVAKRLYRFLDKHFWYRARLEFNLFMLAHEKIGISRNYRFASALRQQLDPALDELAERGFIASYQYLGKGRETVIQITGAAGKPRAVIACQTGELKGSLKVAEEAVPLRAQVVQMLEERGLNQLQAERLVSNRDAQTLQRMRAIIEYYDKLRFLNSRLISRSPIGFLYRAVENPHQFVLPGESRVQGMQESLQLGGGECPAAARSVGSLKSMARKGPDLDTLRAEYLVQRRREAERARMEVEPDLLKRLNLEVENALGKLRGLISPGRFQEAVNQGVDDKLIKLFAFPEFEEWLRQGRKKVA